MSFPERLRLNHFIDGENEKDSVTTKEHQADVNYNTNMEVGATAAAVVNGDAGKTVILLLLIIVILPSVL